MAKYFSGKMVKPVILLDVDGPLNPYASKPSKPPAGYVRHSMRPSGWVATNPLKVLLNPLHGPALMSLDCELIWATAWEDDANDWIGPQLGLPKLPVIDWVERDHGNPLKLHWKTRRIHEWVAENRPDIPFIWLDDEIGGLDSLYLVDKFGNLGLTKKISPITGLTDEIFKELHEWRALWES